MSDTTDTTHVAVARAAFEAYADHTGRLTHDGQPIPPWEDLGITGRGAWQAAVAGALDELAAVLGSGPDAGETPGQPIPGVLVTGGPTTPALGAVVLVLADPAANNGATVAPAIVTRVWNPECINVRVIPDSGGFTERRTSVTYTDDLSAVSPEDLSRLSRWTWPPRT